MERIAARSVHSGLCVASGYASENPPHLYLANELHSSLHLTHEQWHGSVCAVLWEEVLTSKVRLGAVSLSDLTALRSACCMSASVAWSTLAVASSKASTCASCSNALCDGMHHASALTL